MELLLNTLTDFTATLSLVAVGLYLINETIYNHRQILHIANLLIKEFIAKAPNKGKKTLHTSIDTIQHSEGDTPLVEAISCLCDDVDDTLPLTDDNTEEEEEEEEVPTINHSCDELLEEETRKELSTHTVKELRSLAKEHSIHIPSALRKAEIVSAIARHIHH